MSDVETSSPTTITRDYELADQVVADAPEQLKALGDPLRMTICNLVLERAMTVTDLAEHLDRPKGTVAYHVDVLVDAGMLQVVRTRKVRAVEERFYGRVAKTIVFTHASDGMPFIDEVLAEADIDRMRSAVELGEVTVGAGFTTYRRARVPVERIVEYARRLEELAVEFVDEPRDGDTEFGMYLALFPTKRRAGAVHDEDRHET
jgi:DNA-binding transcriptional ArsR family regulator